MNFALSFLHLHRERLELDRYGVPEQLSSLVLTPRFRASQHVVFLIFADAQSDPVLVAKVARLPGLSASLEQETKVLKSVQALRPDGFNSIPRVIAFEEYCGHAILVETAIAGQSMSPPVVRRDSAGCCHIVANWLVDVHRPQNGKTGSSRFDLFTGSLRYFANAFPLSAEEEQALEQTWLLVSPLQGALLPPVLEHGDLSHPNLILSKAGGLGVVDWELALLDGMPTFDLFFFLTYVAFSLHHAGRKGEYLSPFHRAFFTEDAWTLPYVKAYINGIGLPADLLRPLFVLCWARYTSNLLLRLAGSREKQEPVPTATADWLRSNRFYTLWRYTLLHIDSLNLPN